MDRDRNGLLHLDRRGFRQPQSPPIAEKCWTDDDLHFYLTGDYDMSLESEEVQMMLDLASKLNDARVEWLMAESRQQSQSGGHIESYREPRHAMRGEARRRGGIGGRPE